ncbi:hypothetical protein HPB48_016245 [Haemaphysalis longicornis]|uniref:non-specific serine/threonine protein kinase n=1 Tax=Haemaphysalis longicornis TaxID=44386 RepID=A0A9J6GFM4_HAELO|nr:hypothetical protein HPB48_016245 [Haemaphysalis longicornis]
MSPLTAVRSIFIFSLLAVEEKRKNAGKTLATLFPRIPKTAQALLEFFIKRESNMSLQRAPLSHFCQEEVVLHAQDCRIKLSKQIITHQDVRDMVENLVAMHSLVRICIEKCDFIVCVRRRVAASLEKIAEVVVTDWVAVGDAVITKVERMKRLAPPPFSTFIPRMSDFESLKMLGAGGFGAVYLANYRPVNFVATVKLVNTDRFRRQKQAAMDKVVASVIRNPFLVKYYACFCVREAYVTIMEYIPGFDLMRVVTKEEYLDIDAVQIIMAQLILALEHMHLRGFVHRDIKVSNQGTRPFEATSERKRLSTSSGHSTRRAAHRTAETMAKPGGQELPSPRYSLKERFKEKLSAAGRASDWWSAGVVMYKLMTGRVPFRGKTKKLLRERITRSPLKWPRFDSHPHSATAPAKDMASYMLNKNPIERLGSRSYNDLKTHPFFDQFDWQMLYTRTDLCDIAGIQELMEADKEKGAGPDPDDTRQHLQMQDMTDVPFQSQKPLLCYASGSFKKLMTAIRDGKAPAEVSPEFMETSGMDTTPIDYQGAGPIPGSSRTEPGKDGRAQTVEKIDLILFRKKKFCKYWSFGFSLRSTKGEEDKDYVYVYHVAKGSPADESHVLPLDVVLAVNGNPLEGITLAQARSLVASSSDHVVLSIMASSTYRLLTTRSDMMGLLRGLENKTASFKRQPFSCLSAVPYGLNIINADVWDDKAKCFTNVYIVTVRISCMLPSSHNAVEYSM